MRFADRSLPRWSELRPLLRPQRLVLDGVDRRLAGALTIPDLAALALRRVPRAVFDYVHGGADSETALRRSRRAYARTEIVPTVLRDVSVVDPSTTLLGMPSSLPIVFAPTGFSRMMHTDGEVAVARVAAQAGIPYTLSTMGTTSIEALAEAVPGACRWFQLYLSRDREASADLVRRAASAGYRALVLTVDTPVGGPRLRDVRNGLTVPPALTARTVLDAAWHPAWWFDLLTTPPLEFASLSRFGGTPAELASTVFDPTAGLDAVRWLRGIWPGPLVVKGVITPDDARRVIDAGADAVVLSHHGGRQLDRAPTPLEVLPEVLAAVGDRAEVYVDGGLLHGADAVAAVGLGARGVLVGRAYLYGLMAGGERGVRRSAEILAAEVTRTMQLAGITDIEDLAAGGRVRLR